MILALFACTEPPMLDRVAEALAADVVEEATDDVRLGVAVGSVVAETCGVSDVDPYTFVGGGALALGVDAVAREDEADGFTWTFDGVGLDGEQGSLTVTTDSGRRAFAVAWDGDAAALDGNLTMSRCDEAVPESWVTGSLTLTRDEDPRTLLLLGSDGDGLSWSPAGAALPGAGYAQWTREGDEGAGDDTELVLHDATTVADGVWPGTATGVGWQREVEVAFP